MTNENVVDIGGWKYQRVLDISDIVKMGEWLKHNATAAAPAPVGIDCREETIGFAGREQGWLVDFTLLRHSNTAGDLRPILDAMKRSLLYTKGKPFLVARSARLVLPLLRKMFAPVDEEQDRALTASVLHDLEVLIDTTGQPLPFQVKGIGEELLMRSALDCAVTGPQMAADAPSYYEKVALPYLKHEQLKDWMDKKDPSQYRRWTVTYEHLLWKVIAHYTRDPLIVRWFLDEKNPMHEFQALTGLNRDPGDEDLAWSFLMWLVCGQDESLLASAYPGTSKDLTPAPISLRKTTLDEHIPSMLAGFSQLMESIRETPQAKTMFGERSPYGIRPSAGLNFLLIQSVHEIREVAITALVNAGSKYHWTTGDLWEYNDGVDRVTIVGLAPRAMHPGEWRQFLETLMKLDNPLHSTFQQIDLDPKVTCE